jgi:hypothetical protein
VRRDPEPTAVWQLCGLIAGEHQIALNLPATFHPAPENLEAVLCHELGHITSAGALLPHLNLNFPELGPRQGARCAGENIPRQARNVDLDVVRTRRIVTRDEVVDRPELNGLQVCISSVGGAASF